MNAVAGRNEIFVNGQRGLPFRDERHRPAFDGHRLVQLLRHLRRMPHLLRGCDDERVVVRVPLVQRQRLKIARKHGVLPRLDGNAAHHRVAVLCQSRIHRHEIRQRERLLPRLDDEIFSIHVRNDDRLRVPFHDDGARAAVQRHREIRHRPAHLERDGRCRRPQRQNLVVAVRMGDRVRHDVAFHRRLDGQNRRFGPLQKDSDNTVLDLQIHRFVARDVFVREQSGG